MSVLLFGGYRRILAEGVAIRMPGLPYWREGYTLYLVGLHPLPEERGWYCQKENPRFT
ncbi:hypothetical protein [Bacteroides hominis]|uniref:hypothetical protein n=1 Tax=Bacteroides hominis TaxID=2763023 RepID=UPI003D6BD513